jgi:hypothetical protein
MSSNNIGNMSSKFGSGGEESGFLLYGEENENVRLFCGRENKSVRLLCGCRDGRFVSTQIICETETESKSWNALVCENVSPDYIADMYKLYADGEAKLSFCYKPRGQTQLLYEKEHKAFKTDDKLVVLTMVAERLIDPASYLDVSFKPIVGYRVKNKKRFGGGEMKSSLELILNTPRWFGKFHVIGDERVMFIVSDADERMFTIAPSTVYSLLRLSDYCHRPAIFFEQQN